MAKLASPLLPSSQITPESVYLNRRNFIKLAALTAGGSLLSACGIQSSMPSGGITATPDSASGQTDELGAPVNTFEQITSFNNFYEFSMDKTSVAELAKAFPTSPWQVELSGLLHNPRVYDIDDLRKFPQEERIYRLRCVEAWSMVIPWLGFPLKMLLKEAEPMTSAKYARFTTRLDEEHMPGTRSLSYDWPYQEGLRLDEAFHDLTLLATGLYGKELLPQNGAPIRLAVPWKYGFKSSKSIVKIELTEEMPATFWSATAPEEYGFYANVNPNVPHPRWSQEFEQRIGETNRIATLLFNGYAEQVGQLYAGMDLRVDY